MAPKSAVKGKAPMKTKTEKLQEEIAQLQAQLEETRLQEQKEVQELSGICKKVYDLQCEIQKKLGSSYSLRMYNKKNKVDFLTIMQEPEEEEEVEEEFEEEVEEEVEEEPIGEPIYSNLQVALMEEENEHTAEFRNFVQPLVQRVELQFENLPNQPHPEYYISTQQLVDLYRGDILKAQHIRNLFVSMCKNQFDQLYVNRNKKRVYLGFRLLEGSSGTSSDSGEQISPQPLS